MSYGIRNRNIYARQFRSRLGFRPLSSLYPVSLSIGLPYSTLYMAKVGKLIGVRPPAHRPAQPAQSVTEELDAFTFPTSRDRKKLTSKEGDNETDGITGFQKRGLV